MHRVVYTIPLILVLMLVLPALAGTITLNVNLDGNPLPAGTYMVYQNNTLITSGTINNGTTTLSLTPGNYTIYIYAKMSVWVENITVDSNTTTITLNLTSTDGTPAITTQDNATTTSETNTITIGGVSLSKNTMIIIGVGILFIVLIVFAYGSSGKRIPR